MNTPKDVNNNFELLYLKLGYCLLSSKRSGAYFKVLLLYLQLAIFYPSVVLLLSLFTILSSTLFALTSVWSAYSGTSHLNSSKKKNLKLCVMSLWIDMITHAQHYLGPFRTICISHSVRHLSQSFLCYITWWEGAAGIAHGFQPLFLFGLSFTPTSMRSTRRLARDLAITQLIAYPATSLLRSLHERYFGQPSWSKLQYSLSIFWPSPV